MSRPLSYDQTLKAMAFALELLEALPDLDEAEALRLAWLQERERPEPSPQLPLLAAQESRAESNRA